MKRTVYTICTLCEAACGLTVSLDGDRVTGIRGDDADPLSAGHVCPKALALADIQTDPDRLRRPLRRRGRRWVEVDWVEALDEVAGRLLAVQRHLGRDAVGVYFGNPTAHSLGAALAGLAFVRKLGTRNFYTANSVDGLPRLLTSLLLYGSQARLPIPDLDRTAYLPPAPPLERSVFPAVFHNMSVRDVAHYAPPVLPKSPAMTGCCSSAVANCAATTRGCTTAVGW